MICNLWCEFLHWLGSYKYVGGMCSQKISKKKKQLWTRKSGLIENTKIGMHFLWQEIAILIFPITAGACTQIKNGNILDLSLELRKRVCSFTNGLHHKIYTDSSHLLEINPTASDLGAWTPWCPNYFTWKFKWGTKEPGHHAWWPHDGYLDSAGWSGFLLSG